MNMASYFRSPARSKRLCFNSNYMVIGLPGTNSVFVPSEHQSWANIQLMNALNENDHVVSYIESFDYRVE